METTAQVKREKQIIKASKAFALTDLVKNNNGKFFTAKFVKKDGSVRVLNGRFGVRKGTTGKGMKWNPSERGYLNVYDNNKHDYRMINVDTLLEVSFNKKKYIINDNPFIIVYLLNDNYMVEKNRPLEIN